MPYFFYLLILSRFYVLFIFKFTFIGEGSSNNCIIIKVLLSEIVEKEYY